MASVKWTEESLRDLNTLDFLVAKRIISKISWLCENFESITPEPLHRNLRRMYKVRVGDYRAVYEINQKLIVIKFVGHRKDVYK